MTTSPPNPVTQLLAAVSEGDSEAQNKLWSLIYDELHRVAECQMAEEAPGHTLQPTALVHEAYFRLFGNGKVQWPNRRYFFAAAAETMRRIRIDDARRRNRLKRGGGRPGQMTEAPPVFDQDPSEVLAIDEALDKLKQMDPRKAEVVLLRYFAGLSVDECANALEISPRTVDNEWCFARAWLHRELTKDGTTACRRD